MRTVTRLRESASGVDSRSLEVAALAVAGVWCMADEKDEEGWRWSRARNAPWKASSPKSSLSARTWLRAICRRHDAAIPLLW